MLVPLLCALLVGGVGNQDPFIPMPNSQNQENKSIWEGLNIKRTGNNGYEEYLDAIDLYRQARIGEIVRQRSERKASPSDLELCRRILAKMGPVLAKIEQGNLKEVRDPRQKVDVLTIFPELSHLKNISKAITACVHAQFAVGDTKGATNNLIIGLEMADKTSRFNLIAGLVGIANHAILLASTSRYLDQFSVGDSLRLEQWVNSYFSRPNAVAQVMQTELQMNARMLRELMINAKKGELDDYVASDDDDPETREWKQFIDDWCALSTPSRVRIIDSVCNRLSSRNDEFQKFLVGPEKNWVASEIPPGEGFVAMIEELFAPAYQNVFSPFVKQRTQLRLLRLHAAIHQYRFEHDQLPESLSKLNKPLYILDPLTGDNFVYESKSELSYDLYSRGNDQTGRIDLKYKPAPRQESADPSIPPSLTARLTRQR